MCRDDRPDVYVDSILLHSTHGSLCVQPAALIGKDDRQLIRFLAYVRRGPEIRTQRIAQADDSFSQSASAITSCSEAVN